MFTSSCAPDQQDPEMLKLESSVETGACQRILDELGVESLKLNVRGKIGFPDRLFWLPGGRPLLIEFKRVGEEPRKIQTHIHKKLKKLGYMIEVHDDVESAFRAVQHALDATQVPKDRG